MMSVTDTALFGRVEELRSKRAGYTDAEKREIEEISTAVLGRGVKKCRCPDRYWDALVECGIALRNELKNQGKMANKSNLYHLKNGVVIEWEHKVYTHVNLTDEVAAAYLAAYPNAASKFLAIPAAPAKTKTAKKSDAPKAEE